MDREFYESFVGREFCFKSFKQTAWRIVSYNQSINEYSVVVTRCSDSHSVGKKHKYPASEFAKVYTKDDIILSRDIKVTLIRKQNQKKEG